MIYFRADSNPVIASGHIMRCLSLASTLINHGYDVTFLVADYYPINILNSAKVPYIVLNSKWDNLSYEIDKVASILKEHKHSILFIDTYFVTQFYVQSASKYAKVVYIGSKKTVLNGVSAIINYSPIIDRDFYMQAYSSQSTILLLGMEYAPLRQEFQNIIPHSNGTISRILLTTGNTDNLNFTGTFLQEFVKNESFSNIKIDIIVGKMFKFCKKVKRDFSYHSNIVFHEDISDISKIMINCDIAVSSAGTTVYELIAAKVGVIAFALVPEQLESAHGLYDKGLIEYAGEFYINKLLCIRNICNIISTYRKSQSKLLNLIKYSSDVINGNGCEIIYNELLKNKILLS